MAGGRHSGGSTAGFYRDLAMMILGVLLVGAAVFFILYLLVGDDTTGASSDTTTTTVLPTTTTADDVETTTTTQQVTTTPPAETTTTIGVPVRPPSEVRVAVLNSIGVAGAAGRFTEQLAEEGYQTLPPNDYEPEQDPSKIWYREGYSAEANALLEFIPDSEVEPIPDDQLAVGADVVVVLGTGFEE